MPGVFIPTWSLIPCGIDFTGHCQHCYFHEFKRGGGKDKSLGGVHICEKHKFTLKTLEKRKNYTELGGVVFQRGVFTLLGGV